MNTSKKKRKFSSIYLFVKFFFFFKSPSKLDLLWKNKIISEEFHSKTLKEFKIDTTGKIFVQRKKDSLVRFKKF